MKTFGTSWKCSIKANEKGKSWKKGKKEMGDEKEKETSTRTGRDRANKVKKEEIK